MKRKGKKEERRNRNKAQVEKGLAGLSFLGRPRDPLDGCQAWNESRAEGYSIDP